MERLSTKQRLQNDFTTNSTFSADHELLFISEVAPRYPSEPSISNLSSYLTCAIETHYNKEQLEQFRDRWWPQCPSLHSTTVLWATRSLPRNSYTGPHAASPAIATTQTEHHCSLPVGFSDPLYFQRLKAYSHHLLATSAESGARNELRLHSLVVTVW